MERFAPCPGTPNCVSSRDSRPSYNVPALKLNTTIPESELIKKLVEVINRFPRTNLITKEQNYLHVEFKTLLGFVDDVEFELLFDRQILHFRSASRIGYSDLGKNRQRYSKIKQQLAAAGIVTP